MNTNSTKTFYVHATRFIAILVFERTCVVCSSSEVKDDSEEKERKKVPNEINGKANLNGYLYRVIYCIRFRAVNVDCGIVEEEIEGKK